MFTSSAWTVPHQHFSTLAFWWTTSQIEGRGADISETSLVRQLCIVNQSDFLFCAFPLHLFRVYLHYSCTSSFSLLRFCKIINEVSCSLFQSCIHLHHLLWRGYTLSPFFNIGKGCCFPIIKSTNSSKFRISTWRSRLGNRRRTLAVPIWCVSTKPK